MAMTFKQRSILPGFGLTLGFTLLYLSLIVLIPLSATFLKVSTLSWAQFWHTVSAPRAVASYRLSFGASFIAALTNLFFGSSSPGCWCATTFRANVCWTRLSTCLSLCPQPLPASRLPRSIRRMAGLAAISRPIGVKGAYSPLGVVIALTFVGLPFVVRTVQPVLADLEKETEEAAASLGASRWQTFTRVILPAILPAAVTGFTMAFARAIGEYGSVVFISGNMPMRTEITPLLIITKLEQYDYAGATAIAVVMLFVSFTLLLAINVLQKWSSERQKRGTAADSLIPDESLAPGIALQEG